MKLKIGKNEFDLTKLDNLLLLKTGDVPFSLFSVTRGKTIYQQVRDRKNVGNPSGENEFKILRYVLKHGVKTLNNEPFDVDAYLETQGGDVIEAYTVVGQIILLTFKLFRSHTEMNADDVVAIDALAKRYAKTPIEIAFSGLEYSPWDAFVFNLFVAGHAIERELERQKQEMGAYKR